jgi:riboflavin synthase
MFTGLVEELGGVESFERKRGRGILKILATRLAPELELGESIAVNGVCLTVVGKERNSFTVEVSPHTLNSTNIGEAKPGDLVNLERALRLTDRVGGHLVTGHVDGVGVIVERRRVSETTAVSIKLPSSLSRYLVPRGSIAVDGVSLTLASVRGDFFTVYIIPYTAKTTTLGLKGVGSKVNIEVDIIGKYVESLMEKPKKLSYEELIKRLGGS